ncbi:MAG: ligand-binding sensor domain-containing protein, partial [Pyrinomonadaceae bacterium]
MLIRGETRRGRSRRRTLRLFPLLLPWLAGLLLPCVGAHDARAERLPLKVYTTADGLPHNRVNKIVRDSRGFLWFCTEDGLSRFDGYEFKNFGTQHGLPDRKVRDLIETRAGEYFVATGGGLSLFNPKGSPLRNANSGLRNGNHEIRWSQSAIPNLEGPM